MKKFLIFLTLIFSLQLTLYSEIHFGILGAVKDKEKKLYKKIYDTLIYPETDQPPQLTIQWWTGSTISVSDVYVISTFAMPKGDSPGVVDHFTLFVASSANKPIYALCDGIVVSLDRGYNKDRQVIRYGKNYAVEYCHVVNLNPDLYIGKIVKKGDKIGEIWPVTWGYPEGTGYFEVRFLKRKSDGRWIPVDLYEYLDPISKENIKEIWLNRWPQSMAGMPKDENGNYRDIFGNVISSSTIRGAVHELDLPGLEYNDLIIYDYWDNK